MLSRIINAARAIAKTARALMPVAEEINGGMRCPTYLYRWELLSVLGGRRKVYLHKFVGDDWALDPHDHPKRFVSIGLMGRYVEHVGERGAQRTYRAPWVRTFPGTHRHRLTGPTADRPCWTLVVVGPAEREWGFWQGGRFIQWRAYVDGLEARASC